jgi:amino acid transporter
MSLRSFIFGKPLRTEAEAEERIGVGTGIPVLGLDALASASYGPEAALTVLLVAGPAGSQAILPVIGCVLGLLLVVFFSYRQTIAAYPNGGGSFTVVNDNLGAAAGTVAAAALATDYVINAAVAISAGVGALVSAVPALFPHTLYLCLGVLGFLTIVNLRGIRSAGLLFMVPTYAFALTLLITIVAGLWRIGAGQPAPAQAAAAVPLTVGGSGIGVWLLLRAFASGCTAMTGVEAVSNGVPLFRQPSTVLAARTLTAIVALLTVLIGGLAILVRAYDVMATAPGEPGYQSVISQVVAAVSGRGAFYYVTMTSVLTVLALSANTSFADFPRVCRVLAAEHYLPPELARRGSRLVFTSGILLLALLAAGLLVAFGGVTDRLIPLFAVGALLAFSMSQFAMVAHWRAHRQPRWRMRLLINAVGGAATTTALGIVIVSKFTHGAWMTAVVIPALVLLFRGFKGYNDGVAGLTRADGPLDVSNLTAPIVVIPLRRLDHVGRKALRFALTLTNDVHVVQVLADELDTDDIAQRWDELVAEPVRRAGHPPPRLSVLRSPYRRFYQRLLVWLSELCTAQPDRHVIVLIPELVHRRWYQFVVSYRTMRLKAELLLKGGPHVSVMSTPWYPDLRPERSQLRWWAAHFQRSGLEDS